MERGPDEVAFHNRRDRKLCSMSQRQVPGVGTAERGGLMSRRRGMSGMNTLNDGPPGEKLSYQHTNSR